MQKTLKKHEIVFKVDGLIQMASGFTARFSEFAGRYVELIILID
jgi:hypothetical protein